jgi:hypothetical protein
MVGRLAQQPPSLCDLCKMVAQRSCQQQQEMQGLHACLCSDMRLPSVEEHSVADSVGESLSYFVSWHCAIEGQQLSMFSVRLSRSVAVATCLLAYPWLHA